MELDHQVWSERYEVRDVGVDRHLKPEIRAIQAVITQLGPKDPLCVGRSVSERACVGAQSRRDFPGGLLLLRHRDLRCGNTPTPTPPRKRERESGLLLGWCSRILACNRQ